MQTDGSDGSGEGGALSPEALVRSHAAVVLAVCLAYTRNRHDAEDAMQDVFVKAFRNLHTLRDPDRVRAWLLQIARRTCIDHRRRRRPAGAMGDDVAAPATSAHPAAEALHRAIARLPEEYRETITLYYLDGRSCAAVGQSLGISEAAVRQRLVRARLMLHDLLLEEER
jgi:RNA polymerase sigma-70 factor (ECF subfamily)